MNFPWEFWNVYVVFFQRNDINKVKLVSRQNVVLHTYIDVLRVKNKSNKAKNERESSIDFQFSI